MRAARQILCLFFPALLFLRAEPLLAQSDSRPPRIVFIIGEDEYDTKRTLPEFAKAELGTKGFDVAFFHAEDTDANNFRGLENAGEADLIVLSVRRRTPLQAQLEYIRRHIQRGKPVVGIRTASHAFDAKPPNDAHGSWPAFDTEILGYKYEGHYGNKPPDGPATLIKPVPEATTHPVLAGVLPLEFRSTSHLYKQRKAATTVTPLLIGRLENGNEAHPVAWVHTGNNRRVFYTSLGSTSDFELPQFRRLLLNGIVWSLGQATVTTGNTPPPPEARSFKVAEDLELELVLSEPIVRQPVFLNFDERGRMWVVQYLQYPSPAGLQIVSRDNVWRAIYDKVPPPPPNHFRGADKITIHEDTDGDGSFDKHKTFVDGLNIVSSLAQGRGGVWVLNPPYLLFYPDKNRDDVPDGNPVVHLAGFGLEDTHSVANSLRWGPDGWLYAAQGSTVTGNIVCPGVGAEEPERSLGQLIWRYHPESRRYEVFAEGGGNAFGVEIDSKGRVFSGHNGGNTRGFHYVQGGYLQKGFEKHGPLSNPHAYGYFPPMKHPDVERFTHNFVIYESVALPERHHGKLFGIEPLQGRVVVSDFIRDGSTFRTSDLFHAVTSSDDWFRPVDIKEGPDGFLYICDWHDRQVNHYRNHEGQIDRATGRIYRLKPKGARPASPRNMAALPTTDLLAALKSPGRWERQTAIRLLGDRKEPRAASLCHSLITNSTGQLALEGLWALHAVGGFNDHEAIELLEHPDPHVRLWTVRLAADKHEVSSELASRMASLAHTEPDIEARAQLASSARRLPAHQGLPIIRGLLDHGQDASDPRVPLLIWWALESWAVSDRAALLDLFHDKELWSKPIVQEHLLERMMRRLAHGAARQDFLQCATLLALAPEQSHRAKLLQGFNAAFAGRGVSQLPVELAREIQKAGGGSPALRVRLGDEQARELAGALSPDYQIARQARLELIQAFGDVKEPAAVPHMLALLPRANDPGIERALLTALQNFPDAKIGKSVADQIAEFTGESRAAALNLLASRPAWARFLLAQVEAGTIQAGEVPLDIQAKLRAHADGALLAAVEKLWPRAASSSAAEEQIGAALKALAGGSGNPYAGQEIFTTRCSSCHKLYGKGGDIGPDLTTLQRDNVETMLLGIIKPSAEIREGYENLLITTKDERALSGFIVDQDEEVISLRGLGGETFTLKRSEVQEMKKAGISLMPDGLVDDLDDQQLRDLFAYLRMRQPLVR